MEEITIRAGSVERLFDEWSAEPLERRPLNDEARERILDAWDEGKKKGETPPSRVCLILPATERSDGIEETIATAFQRDMEQVCFDTHHHWIRRSLKARETRIGFIVFFVAMVISVLISDGGDGDSLETLLSQTFVVIAWVALWAPAGRFIRGASYRLERKSFDQLAKTRLVIRWE